MELLGSLIMFQSRLAAPLLVTVCSCCRFFRQDQGTAGFPHLQGHTQAFMQPVSHKPTPSPTHPPTPSQHTHLHL